MLSTGSITALSGVLLSLPAFWVGVILVYFFSVRLRLAAGDRVRAVHDNPEAWVKSLVLPVLTVAIISIGGHRPPDAGVDVRDADAGAHAHPARDRHADDRIVYVHALRGASLPILASVAIQFIVLFGGSVVIEVLFALPGIGQAMQSAVGSADLPFVQALVLVATVVVVLVNLVLELLNRTLDPKLRAS